MSRLKGLAWDDEEEYIMSLKDRLAASDIDLEVRHKQEEFYDDLSRGEWDFVVLDIFEDGINSVGVQLAKAVSLRYRNKPWYPIFLITSLSQRLTPATFDLPPNVVIQFKFSAAVMASYIRDHLEQRGVLVNRRKAFLIYCADKDTFRKYGDKVRKRLATRHLDVEIIADALKSEIAAGLLRNMNECAAIIAVCTPDDEWRDGTCHPRENVLLEIGMALGLSRGMDRLIILQKVGREPHQIASLPSDLGGVLTIQFRDSISEAFSQMERQLQDIGVDLSGT